MVLGGRGCRFDLFSFPTRRSSDLGAREFVATDRRRLDGGARTQRRLGGTAPGAGDVRQAVAARTRCGRRSEEHTSELQSRENLGCRLLLEKKKQRPCPRCCCGWSE